MPVIYQLDPLTLEGLPPRLRRKIRIDPVTQCWLWIGARTKAGYGNAWYRKRNIGAHRLVWRYIRGRLPRRELDHLCRVRHCVNPRHLEQVSRAENNRRSTCWVHLHQ